MGFWRKDFTNEEIRHILGKLKPLRRFSEDGARVSLSAGNYEPYASFLVSALGMEVRTDALKSDIVRRALLSPELPAEFTEKEFSRVAYRLRHKFQERDVRPHRVVFALWNIPPFLKGVRRKDGVTINFSPSARTRLLRTVTRAREEQRSKPWFRDHFTETVMSDLQSCSTCIAHVVASSPADAHERVAEALYEIFGLINMAKDGGKHWRLSTKRLPVSEVLIGPHTTTHNADGSLTHDGFWYENWAGRDIRSRPPKEMLASWEENYGQLVQGVARSPWPELCSSAAARYFKAFSNPNLEESFLEGWRLFENISGPEDDKVERKLIRVANVFQENTEHRIIGKHLALRRNLITHGRPISADDEETLAFQMLQFVHPYLTRFIMNQFSFAAPEEFWEFLDLQARRSERSDQAKELRRRLSLLDKVARFRGET
ncbi:MAG: hypothetical protein F4X97_09720 [Boseongicola sp. SB0662_bin_57]|nr:hypothetical protein [Boseongicola sp. SB0662_bin_57]